MSPPFFRNLIIASAILGLALPNVVPTVAQAQAGATREGHKFLEAVRERDGNIVEEILNDPKTSILVNTRDISSGETAMHIAAERNDALWLTFLAENGANPNIANRDGVTPLMISTRKNHVEGVTALLAAGARIDPVSSTGETPLILAVHQRSIPMVRLLLTNGADPDRTDSSGRSARDYVRLIGERRLADEIAKADEDRANKSSASQYGPSF